jgi:hypothetical protein
MVEVIEKSQPVLRKRLKPSEFGPWTVDKKYELDPKTKETITNKNRVLRTKSSQKNGPEKSYQKLSTEGGKKHSNTNVLMKTAMKMSSSQTPSPPFVKSKFQ